MDSLNIHSSIYGEIIQGIMSESYDSIPQCYYVFGRRGYGKTELLRKMEQTLKATTGYNALYIDCLMHPSFTIEEAIRNYHREENRLVLILDDMDIFLNCMRRTEQFRLRSLLLRKGAPVIVGAGAELSSDFTDYQAPFYDAFILYHLKELAPDISIELIKQIRRKSLFYDMDIPLEIVSELLDEMGRTPESCRLLSQVSSFGVERKKILFEALNSLSLYYREKINSLSPSQRKTLLFMLSRKEPVLLKDIRKATNQTGGDISPQLKSLSLKGLISVIKQGAKKTEYSIADKIMSSWYRNCIIQEDASLI